MEGYTNLNHYVSKDKWHVLTHSMFRSEKRCVSLMYSVYFQKYITVYFW